MDISYLITPLLTWILVGPIKFLINSARKRRWAFDLVGNGGFPSNHSAVATSMVTMIALREGINHPAFGVAITLAFIVMIDAYSLRRHVGKHAEILNRLQDKKPNWTFLRERMGHTLIEIVGGVLTGMSIGTAINYFNPTIF